MKLTARICIFIAAFLLLALPLFGCDADREEKTEGLVFSLNGDGKSYTVSDYTGEATEVTVPARYEGKKVTVIGAYAFEDCEEITAVTLPSTVKTIGVRAFSDCVKLEDIDLPDSVESIGDGAFESCEALVEITLPAAVKAVGADAFKQCDSLVIYATAATRPLDWDKNFNGARPVVWDCRSNSRATDGYEYTVINGLRYGLKEEKATVLRAMEKDAESITVPSSVTYKEKKYAVTKIGNKVFFGCESLTEVTLPDTVEEIGDHAFKDCEELSSITLPSSLKEIGDHAFEDCEELVSITLPSSLETIGEFAFQGCSALSEIVIPASVERIGDKAFTGPLVIYVEAAERPVEWHPTWHGSQVFVAWGWHSGTLPDSNMYAVVDGLYYAIKDGKATVMQAVKHTETVAIPASVGWGGLTYAVTAIGDGAFKGDTVLTSITLPDTVKKLGASAFSGCTALTSVTLPSALPSIGDYAFDGCTALSSLSFPTSLTTIGNYAFRNCRALSALSFPASLATIGACAFDGCRSLTELLIPSSVTTVGNYAFRGCTALASLNVSGTGGSIGMGAFSGCTRLVIALLHSPIAVIGEGAFEDCDALRIYTDYTEKPTSWAIYWNSSYRPVEWGISRDTDYVTVDGLLYSLKNGEATVVSQPTSIVNARIKERITYKGATYTVTVIERGAFADCRGLATVVIPNTVTSIGENAFRNCDSLVSIILPTSVKTVARGVFTGCTSLTIYTRHMSVPSGFVSNWNCDRPVRWGVR